jgi:chaperonin GroEL (HSP60 family)
MDYAKVKSVAKRVEVEGPELDAILLETMAKIAKAVGGTLGPGGKTVLIERYEHDLPPIMTKDGVTVYR